MPLEGRESLWRHFGGYPNGRVCSMTIAIIVIMMARTIQLEQLQQRSSLCRQHGLSLLMSPSISVPTPNITFDRTSILNLFVLSCTPNCVHITVTHTYPRCNPRTFLENPLYISHVGKSMYSSQLERWFSLFGRENFKVGWASFPCPHVILQAVWLPLAVYFSSLYALVSCFLCVCVEWFFPCLMVVFVFAAEKAVLAYSRAMLSVCMSWPQRIVAKEAFGSPCGSEFESRNVKGRPLRHYFSHTSHMLICVYRGS